MDTGEISYMYNEKYTNSDGKEKSRLLIIPYSQLASSKKNVDELLCDLIHKPEFLDGKVDMIVMPTRRQKAFSRLAA